MECGKSQWKCGDKITVQERVGNCLCGQQPTLMEKSGASFIFISDSALLFLFFRSALQLKASCHTAPNLTGRDKESDIDVTSYLI